MATILIADPRELVAVDRFGKILVPGIMHTGDFDYPAARHGLGRFTVVTRDSNGNPVSRCGYFRADRFQILVPARFDQCQPFADQQALACTDCMAYCTETDCQNRVLVGGTGTLLGTDGTVRRTYPLPSVARICGTPDLVRITNLDSGAKMLTCIRDSNDPFNKL